MTTNTETLKHECVICGRQTRYIRIRDRWVCRICAHIIHDSDASILEEEVEQGRFFAHV